jgi:YfiR/HmsC-like
LLLLASAAVGAALCDALLPRPAAAEDVVVPVGIQIKLLVKVAAYDKNLPKRAGDKVRVLVSAKANNADAQRVSAQALAALAEHDSIAGLPISVSTGVFTSGADLKRVIQKNGIAIVYLASGLNADDVAGVVSALDGVDVLNASATPTDVPRGIVLGFDLVSSKPKLCVHLGQAKKQKVALSADVLKLAKVFE